MYYIGCDQHKHYSKVMSKDQQGIIQQQEKLYHDNRDSIRTYFTQQPKGSVVALEACGFEPWLCDLIEEAGLTVKLVHPKKTRAIAEEKIKTDDLSASTLADLLRADLICEAYHAPAPIRDDRYLGRYRLSLVRMRTMTKNKIHDILARLGVTLPAATDLFGKTGRQYLETLELKPVYQKAIKGYLQLLDTLNGLIDPIEQKLRGVISDKNIYVKMLKTLPGVGPILAHIIAAESGDIHRFRNSSKFSGYVGIIPSLHQSGKIHRLGSITKEGNRYLRWAFVEAAHKAIRFDPYLAQFYNKIRYKKGKNVAVVAVAHKLAIYTYWILKEQKPFQPKAINERPRI